MNYHTKSTMRSTGGNRTMSNYRGLCSSFSRTIHGYRQISKLNVKGRLYRTSRVRFYWR